MALVAANLSIVDKRSAVCYRKRFTINRKSGQIQESCINTWQAVHGDTGFRKALGCRS
jgi:hypothetical protein